MKIVKIFGKRGFSLIITILTVTNLVAAECPSYKSLESGEIAPCRGSFFSKKAEETLKNNYSKLEKTNENLTNQVKLSDLQIELHKEKTGIWKQEAENQSNHRKDMEWNYTKGVLIGTGGAILMFFVNSLVIKAVK